jgi:hypothetical protein
MTVTAAEDAVRMVEAVRDDPMRRLEVAARLYDDRPGRASIRGYRRAELAFMRWQIRRGVLASMTSARPGSRWWRAVNGGLLRDTCEADRLVAGAGGSASRPAVTRWVQFLLSPSPELWYRAHNASIVAGYLENRHLSEGELPVERFFMDVALGRVLFVHTLVMDPGRALGRWLWPVGRLIGDPRWRGADMYLSLRNVLPDHYPLTDVTIIDVLKAENPAGRLIDYGVLLPHAQAAYEFAAADLGEPGILEFISNGNLVYAWGFQDRYVWVPKEFRRLCAVLAWMTSAPRPRRF